MYNRFKLIDFTPLITNKFMSDSSDGFFFLIGLLQKKINFKSILTLIYPHNFLVLSYRFSIVN